MNPKRLIPPLAALLLFTLLWTQRPVQAVDEPIFINEIHYDNESTDANEGVEIAGPAGTDLSGWQLIAYNGSGGAIYDTINLSGTIPNQQSGFGTIFFAIPGLQNGAPDGIALVDNSSTVIQFLSYEGSFTASNGPASGLTSADIGVTELSSTPTNESLQLTGTGCYDDDFTWTGPSASSYDAINTGQTFDCGGGDAAPTVSSTSPIDGASNVAVDDPISVTFSEPVTLTGTVEVNCSISGLQNTVPTGGSVTFTLPHSDFSDGDSCNVTITAAQVTDLDSDDPPDNMEDPASWNFTVGTPPPADLLINEVDADTPGTDAAEFVELYDGGSGNTALDGYTLVFFNGSDDASYNSFDLDGYTTDANGYFVVGNTGVANVSITFGGNGLQNGADAVALYQADATDFPNGTAVTTTNLIDALVYDTNDSDDTGLLVLLNTGQAQINEGTNDSATESNQRCPNGSGDARNTNTYAQDTPSPGATNNCPVDIAPTVSSTNPTDGATDVPVASPVTITFSEAVTVTGTIEIDCPSGIQDVTPTTSNNIIFSLPHSNFSTSETCTVSILGSQVADQDGTIDNMAADYSFSFTTGNGANTCSTIPEIQGTGNNSPCLGVRNNIEGCITGVAAKGIYVQDVNGDGEPNSSDGIFAYFWSTWTNPSNFSVGDLVEISGEVVEYYDTTEFANSGSNPLSVNIVGNCTLPAPVTISPVSDPTVDPMSLYEQYEGMRVQMSFDGYVVGPTTRYVSRFVNGEPEIAFVDSSSSIYGSRVFQDDFTTYSGYEGINYISGGFNKNLPDVSVGDHIAATSLIGVLGYQFDKYTILVDEGTVHNYTITNNPTIPEKPIDLDAEEYSLCTFNLENLFDHIDDSDGDMGDWTPADSTEYNQMLEKRAKAIVDELGSCLVIGVQEIEGKDPIWDDLVATITAQGGPTFAYDYYESTDPRDITVGILYDTNRVTLNTSDQMQGCTTTNYSINYAANADNTYGRVVGDPCGSGEYALFNRPPYVGRLTITNGNSSQSVNVSVIVNHFKSKRGDETVNLPRRVDQAAHVVSLMQAEHTAGTTRVVALGDFNDYLSSAPIAEFNSASVGGNPVVNLYNSHVPANERYSFIFGGLSGVLDHFMVTDELDNGFIYGRTVHINADYPDIGTMGTDNCTGGPCPVAITDNTSRRSSDHDPLYVRFGFPVIGDLSDLDTTYGIARHTGAHTVWLGGAGDVSDDATSGIGTDDLTDNGVDHRITPTWGGGTGTVDVTVSGGASCLHGWIDWDGDGTFEEDVEHVINGAITGTGTYPFAVPAGVFSGAGGNVFLNARFRVYSSCPTVDMLAAYGTAVNGEVEDYTWEFTPTAVTLQSFNATNPHTLWLAALLVIVTLLAGSLLMWRNGRSRQS